MRTTRTRLRTHGTRSLAAFLVIGAFVMTSARAEDDASAASLRAAEMRLEELERQIRRRSTARLAGTTLEAASAALEALTAPTRPELLPVAEDASETAIADIAKENKERLRRWLRSIEDFEKRKSVLVDQWVGLLGKFLTMEARHPLEPWNFRPGIQCRALELIVRTERPDAALTVMKAVSVWLECDVPWIGARFLLAAFEALPRFQSTEVLHWLCEEFVGKERDYRVQEYHLRVARGVTEVLTVDAPLLALRAMVRHDGLAGRNRRKAVRKLIATYERVEGRAPTVRHLRAQWTRVGEAARNATWSLAGKPIYGFTSLPPSMAEMATWLGEHGAPHDPAWRD